ncbi:MAG: hypothetical protein H6668_19085 [Ardenticatenaceae bacterium]|nr:hypothetical protein [Ardenticatenaceae bacterium]
MTAIRTSSSLIFARVDAAELAAGWQLLELVGLGDGFHHKPAEHLVGSSSVAIARALGQRPAPIVLADEPQQLDTPVLAAVIDIFGTADKVKAYHHYGDTRSIAAGRYHHRPHPRRPNPESNNRLRQFPDLIVSQVPSSG